MREKVDVLVVGAGFSGMTVAERLASQGFKVAVVDKRSHPGGNATEARDRNGVLYHPWGPHIFHTRAAEIRRYVGLFTEWRKVDVRVTSSTRGRPWSFPPNLGTFEQWLGRPANLREFREWLKQERCGMIGRNAEEQVLATAGRTFFEMFYRGYILKMWGRDPSSLDALVGGRVPVHERRSERYLHGFQALPLDGYGHLFGNMLDRAGAGLQLRTGVSWETARGQYEWRHLVFTGAIDEYYGREFGALPFRTLAFTVESYDHGGLRQPSAVVATPDPEVPWTRSTELGHLTGQESGASVIVREQASEWHENKGAGLACDTSEETPALEPLYPVPCPEARALRDLYEELADREEKVSFIGRLGRYRYYNMDQAVAMALKESTRIASRLRAS